MLFKAAFNLFSPAGVRGRLSILIFHRVLPEPDPLLPDEVDVGRFDQMMGWVTNWFNVLPLDQAINQLHAGNLPARAAAITFDDGYADNYTLALPILRRHGATATFFIASGFLDGGRMWNDTVIESVRRTELAELDAGLAELPVLPLHSLAERRQSLQRLISAVKHLPPLVRAETVERIARSCAADLPRDLMLTTCQLRSLHSAGMQIGAHTVSHPILATTEQHTAQREIAESKKQLESILGEQVRLFAYPNGRPGKDYLPLHVDMVREMGFDAAVSTHWGVNARHDDPFQLRRFTPWDRGRMRFGMRFLNNFRSS